GARVFAGGAQQLSWPLDTFNLGRFGRTLPPDPRFQQFIRNVFDDLERPASPATLELRQRLHTVKLTVGGVQDTRVIRYELFRHAGSAPFRIEDAGVVKICDAVAGQTCTEHRLVGGVYRFAAVSVDQWGTSYPTLSQQVVVRRRR